MFAVFGRQHAGQQTRSGDTPVYGPRGRRGFSDTVAPGTGFFHPDGADHLQRAGDQFQLFRTDFAEVFHGVAAFRTTGFSRLQPVYLAGKVFRKRAAVPRLAKLTRNLRIIIPSAVAIIFLLLLLQQGFGLLHLLAELFGAGAEQHPPQLFQLRPQMLYFALFIFDFFLSACQR